MMRTVWLALFLLAGLVVMAALKVGTAPASPPENATHDQTTTGMILAQDTLTQDTLTKSDRLDVTYVNQSMAAEPAPPIAAVPPEPPSSKPKTITKIVSRHWHDPNAKNTAVSSPSRQTKNRVPKKGDNVDRTKPAAEVKPCRTDAFGSMLRSLKLSPECET